MRYDEVIDENHKPKIIPYTTKGFPNDTQTGITCIDDVPTKFEVPKHNLNRDLIDSIIKRINE